MTLLVIVVSPLREKGNKLKKIGAWVLASILVIGGFSGGTPALAKEEVRTVESYILEDIWEHWGFEELDDLVNADIFKGFPTGDHEYSFKPDHLITRAEFAAIIVRALDLQATGEGERFDDIPVTHSLQAEIAIASDHGIIEGVGAGRFAPNEPVLREQIAAMIVRAFSDTVSFPAEGSQSFHDVASDHWAAPSIAKAAGAEIVRGITSTQFGFNKKATRGEAGVMLHRALQKETSNLPNANELMQIVKDSEVESFPLFEQKDASGLLSHNKKYLTGYQKALADDLAMWYFDDETTETMAFAAEPKLEMKQSSNRFAQVSLQGELNVRYQDRTTNFETTIDYHPVYYLKKTDGIWKIYYSDMPLEFEALS